MVRVKVKNRMYNHLAKTYHGTAKTFLIMNSVGEQDPDSVRFDVLHQFKNEMKHLLRNNSDK